MHRYTPLFQLTDYKRKRSAWYAHVSSSFKSLQLPSYLLFPKAQRLALPFAASDRLGKSSVSKFLSKSPFFFPVQKRRQQMEKTVSILTGELLSCASKRWEKIQTQNINHRVLPIIVCIWLAVQLHSCGFSTSKLRDKHPCCLQVDLQTCLTQAFQRVLGVL